MANLTPTPKEDCLDVSYAEVGATGDLFASAAAGNGQRAARGEQSFSFARSRNVNCRMIPLRKG